MVIWNIEQGLTYIRALQDKAFDLHYNLSLGGGVMMRGHSSHDLDIICTPANGTFDSDPTTYHNFIKWLETIAESEGATLQVGWWNGTTRKACFNDRHGRKIDWFVGYNAHIHGINLGNVVREKAPEPPIEDLIDFDDCGLCGSPTWDGYICHSCGLKAI